MAEEGDGSLAGKRQKEKGRGRVVFSFCRIVVIYPTVEACACFVRTLKARVGLHLDAEMKKLFDGSSEDGQAAWNELMVITAQIVFMAGFP